MALSAASRTASPSRVRSGFCIQKEYLDRDGARKKCSKAVSGETQTPIGAFVCSECHRQLVPVPRNHLWVKTAAGGVLALLLVGGGGYLGYRYLHQPRHPACNVNERLPDLVAHMKPEEMT